MLNFLCVCVCVCSLIAQCQPEIYQLLKKGFLFSAQFRSALCILRKLFFFFWCQQHEFHHFFSLQFSSSLLYVSFFCLYVFFLFWYQKRVLCFETLFIKYNPYPLYSVLLILKQQNASNFKWLYILFLNIIYQYNKWKSIAFYPNLL